MTSAETIVGLVSRGRRLWNRVRKLVAELRREVAAYENVSMETVLDIRDPRGRIAVLQRRQALRPRSNDTVVIRELIWGDGQALNHYTVRGARRMDLIREGPRWVVLLRAEPSPAKGDLVWITSRHEMHRAFVRGSEYFEMMAERPTERMRMRVLFPRSRPPKDVRMVTVPPSATSRRLSLRHSAAGRPFVAWSEERPLPFHTYSLRWSW